MGVTTAGLNVFAANMAGSALPTHIAIGDSGTTFTSGDTSLANETDRNIISDFDLSTNSQVTMISNYTPIEMSGTILREFGVMTTGSTMVNRSVLNGSAVFDGDQELQIQQTFKFYI